MPNHEANENAALPLPGDTVCPNPGCKGALCNVTPRLAEALGIMHVKCDECHDKWAIDTKHHAAQ